MKEHDVILTLGEILCAKQFLRTDDMGPPLARFADAGNCDVEILPRVEAAALLDEGEANLCWRHGDAPCSCPSDQS